MNSSSSLSSQLQDYLKKSTSPGSSSNSSSSLFQSTGGGSSRFSWFASKDTPQQSVDSDSAVNGWLSEAQKDPLLPSLTKKQRVLGFVGCLLMGTLCFSLASLYIPFLLLKARKFALLYTFGSIFIIASFALLWGPYNHFKHLLSTERLPFTVTYFGTMTATLYFALSVQSMVMTVIFAVAQVLALIWYVVSYIPGGHTGLKFFTKIFYAAASKTVQKTLPV
jgi:hypothetical protein